MDTILVTDKPLNWKFASTFTRVVAAIDYVSDLQYNNCQAVRIVNLCKDYSYQSLGYYVSLLAEARGHKIFPSVLAIQDFKNPSMPAFSTESLTDDLEEGLKRLKSNEFVLSIYFGKNMAQRYTQLCYKLHSLFPMPLFRVHFKKKKEWKIQRIEAISMSEVPDAHLPFLQASAKEYFNKKRFRRYKNKQLWYDMAMLCSKEEKNPPSNEGAVKRFIQAGESMGIHVEQIEKEDFKFLAEYDSLFIRETTAVNHHTYRFARRALAEGLVVIDDPESILKCTNKVYLAELLQKHNISQPKTYLISKHNWRDITDKIPVPCVLKKPDSAFSIGVVKAESRSDMKQKVEEFLNESQLIIAQSYIPTTYDWRIGILDNKPIYACRYFMAEGHWQIYNWDADQSDQEGGSDGIPIFEVPKKVLQTALKATKLIGRGLYGVDIKEHKNEVYIIEVNDNPSIDHGVEDSLLGDELYVTIMSYFLNEMRRNHGYK